MVITSGYTSTGVKLFNTQGVHTGVETSGYYLWGDKWRRLLATCEQFVIGSWLLGQEEHIGGGVKRRRHGWSSADNISTQNVFQDGVD